MRLGGQTSGSHSRDEATFTAFPAVRKRPRRGLYALGSRVSRSDRGVAIRPHARLATQISKPKISTGISAMAI
jgi:hypothetical protein